MASIALSFCKIASFVLVNLLAAISVAHADDIPERPSLRDPGLQLGWFGIQVSAVLQIGGGSTYTAGILWEPAWVFGSHVAARMATGVSFYRSAAPANFLATALAPTLWVGNFGSIPLYFEAGGGVQVWWDQPVLVLPIIRADLGWEFAQPLLIIDRVHVRWEYKHLSAGPMHELSVAGSFEFF